MRMILCSIVLLSLTALVGAAPPVSTPWPVPEAARVAVSPISRSLEAVAAGEPVYVENCVMCHGEAGAGDGISSGYLAVPPGDLTKLARQTDGELHWKIAKGRRPMPGFAGKLTDEQLWQLVQYLRTFAPPAAPEKAAPKPTPGDSTPGH